MNEEMWVDKGMVGFLWSWNRLTIRPARKGILGSGTANHRLRLDFVDQSTLWIFTHGDGLVSLGTGRVWQDNNKYNKITLFVRKH